MRLFLATLTMMVGVCAVGTANAQSRNLEDRVNRLERKVSDQERTIDELFERVDRMDRRGRPGPGPGPRPGNSSYSCMIVDSGYKKTFLGVGSTQIDAEFAAKETCQKSVDSSYCQSTPKCDSTRDMKGSPGAVCIVVDSGYKKTFRGEGETVVAAEARAKQACQASVDSSYCGPVAARCDLK